VKFDRPAFKQLHTNARLQFFKGLAKLYSIGTE